MLTVCSRSDPGSVRTINEDRAVWNSALGFMAVADGMGGHNAGEVASRIALEAATSFLEKSANDDDFTWPFGVDPTLSFGANRLVTAVKIANRRVFRASEERSEYTGMGTTLVAVLVEESRFCFASVGDSRIYAVDSSGIRQLSQDDTWIVMLSNEPGVDAATLKRHPMRHVLTNVLGARSDIEVSAKESTLTEGGVLILCTDGLHGAVSDETLGSITRDEPDLQRAADRLVQTALEQDGRDNITVLLARYTA